MPEPGNPQALNRYAYAPNNPIRYTDPSGHWVETAWDLFSIGLTLNDICREGLTWQNGLALAVDVTAALLPVPAFAGVVLKGGKAADKLLGTARVASLLTDSARTGTRLVEQLAGSALTAMKAAPWFVSWLSSPPKGRATARWCWVASDPR